MENTIKTTSNNLVEDIRSRLNFAKENRGLSQNDILFLMNKISDEEKVAQTTISLILSGKTKKIDAVFCRLFAQATDVSLVWILTGLGSVAMPFEGVAVEYFPGLVEDKQESYKSSEYLEVPIYNVFEKHSELVFKRIEIDQALIVRKSVLPSSGEFYGLKVRDNSLAPELSYNDVVVIDHQDKEPAEGATFAVWLNGRPLIRKLSMPYSGYLLTGENPSVAPIEVSEEDRKNGNFQIIGRIILRAGKIF